MPDPRAIWSVLSAVQMMNSILNPQPLKDQYGDWYSTVQEQQMEELQRKAAELGDAFRIDGQNPRDERRW